MKSKASSRTLDVELDRTTVDRLRERAETEGIETMDGVVSRVLDETTVSITLDEFIDRIVANGDVAQIAVHKVRTDPLDFIVHSGTELDDGLFEDVHAVEVNGEPHRFRLDVTASGPQTLGRVTVYTEEPIQAVNSDSVEGDVENLEEWIEERREEIEQND